MGRLAGVVVAVTAMTWSAAAPASAAERVDQACEQRQFGAWLHFTQAQSFVPGVAAITSIDFRVVFLRSFHGSIDVRLVHHPLGEQAAALTAGRVVHEAPVPLSGAGLTAKWVTFRLPAPVVATNPSGRGVYALHVDLPVDRGGDGGPMAWAFCDRGIPTGRAYVTHSADSLNRTAWAIGLPSAPGRLAREPVTADRHPRAIGFQVRIRGM